MLETQLSSEAQLESGPSSVPSWIPLSYQTQTQTELDVEGADVGTEGTIGLKDWRDNLAGSHPKAAWMETQTPKIDSGRLQVPHLIPIVDWLPGNM